MIIDFNSQTDGCRFFGNVGGSDGDDAQRLVLDGKYAFKANATGHVYAGYSNLEQEGEDDQDGFGIGTGIEYKF